MTKATETKTHYAQRREVCETDYSYTLTAAADETSFEKPNSDGKRRLRKRVQPTKDKRRNE